MHEIIQLRIAEIYLNNQIIALFLLLSVKFFILYKI